MTKQEESRFQARLARHHDELRWLYMELYNNGSMFAELCDQMHRFYQKRRTDAEGRTTEREAESDWYKNNRTCWG